MGPQKRTIGHGTVGRLRQAGAVAAALLCGGLAVAACAAGAAPPGVASIGSTTTDHSGQASAHRGSSGSVLSFAECLRSHGEPSFPDPDAQGQFDIQPGSGINPGSPQFQSAQKACQHLLPNGGQLTAAQREQAVKNALGFSKCMRSHGISNFPDPDISNGGAGFHISIKVGTDLDPNAPQFQAAQQACQHLMVPPKGGKGVIKFQAPAPGSGSGNATFGAAP